MGWELAQLNIALWAVDPTSVMARGFRRRVPRVDAAGAASIGWVWQRPDDADDPSPWGGEWLHNLTVWTDVEALRRFTFEHPEHVEVMRRRRSWFTPTDEATTVLWWVAAGHRPTLAEAAERLDLLRRHGATDAAFTFRDPRPAPS